LNCRLKRTSCSGAFCSPFSKKGEKKKIIFPIHFFGWPKKRNSLAGFVILRFPFFSYFSLDGKVTKHQGPAIANPPRSKC